MAFAYFYVWCVVKLMLQKCAAQKTMKGGFRFLAGFARFLEG